jgi:hypothetical protein
MTPIIPLELSEMIIDYLYCDKRALGRCGLVCRFWLPSSRFHLFSTIRLAQWNMDKALAALCPSRSTILPYVSCINVDGDADKQEFYKSLARLPPLNSVESLVLFHFYWDSRTRTFLVMDKMFPFLRNLKTLQLDNVAFETLHIAFEFISSATLLECLRLGSIHGLGFWGFKKIDAASLTRFPLPPLKQIAFDGRFYMPSMFDWLHLGRPVASVNSVTLHGKYVPIICSVAGFLRALGPVLEHFVIIGFGLDSEGHGMHVSCNLSLP